jgi:alkaline phosphatase
MPNLSKVLAILAGVLAGGCAPVATQPPSAAAPDNAPQNVVFLLADGAGVEYWTALTHAREAPAFARMPFAALVGTASANRRVPDSSASASAYATGERVTNRVVAMVNCPQPRSSDPVGVVPEGCTPVESWFDLARERGKARGTVTTTRIVDASIAAFVAKSPSRYWYENIGEQFAGAGLEVMLGGGRGYFEAGTRSDGRDLLAPLCAQSACVSTAAELSAYAPDGRPLVGLFAPDDLGSVAERPVSLIDMADAALARLSRDPDGFVLIIESEGTDNAGHANEPLSAITTEMLAFDDAVGLALDFAEANPGTLVIATADHETGGLSLVDPAGDDALTGIYTTEGHTAAMVPLFAHGPGAERLAGVHTNAQIGQILMDLLSRR